MHLAKTGTINQQAPRKYYKLNKNSKNIIKTVMEDKLKVIDFQNAGLFSPSVS